MLILPETGAARRFREEMGEAGAERGSPGVARRV